MHGGSTTAPCKNREDEQKNTLFRMIKLCAHAARELRGSHTDFEAPGYDIFQCKHRCCAVRVFPRDDAVRLGGQQTALCMPHDASHRASARLHCYEREQGRASLPTQSMTSLRDFFFATRPPGTLTTRRWRTCEHPIVAFRLEARPARLPSPCFRAEAVRARRSCWRQPF